MAVKAKCPYCHGLHRSKKAFNACKKKNANWTWTRDGQKKASGGK